MESNRDVRRALLFAAVARLGDSVLFKSTQKIALPLSCSENKDDLECCSTLQVDPISPLSKI